MRREGIASRRRSVAAPRPRSPIVRKRTVTDIPGRAASAQGRSSRAGLERRRRRLLRRCSLRSRIRVTSSAEPPRRCDARDNGSHRDISGSFLDWHLGWGATMRRLMILMGILLPCWPPGRSHAGPELPGVWITYNSSRIQIVDATGADNLIWVSADGDRLLIGDLAPGGARVHRAPRPRGPVARTNPRIRAASRSMTRPLLSGLVPVSLRQDRQDQTGCGEHLRSTHPVGRACT